MNLIEAMKSGKRYKRRFQKEWYDSSYSNGHSNLYILADDWEVEQEVFTFTESELKEVLNVSYKRLRSYHTSAVFNVYPDELQLLIEGMLETIREDIHGRSIENV